MKEKKKKEKRLLSFYKASMEKYVSIKNHLNVK